MVRRRDRFPETSALQPYERIHDCVGQALASSVADETELVWLERRYGVAEHGAAGQQAVLEAPLLTVLVRVAERGRIGWYRTDTADAKLLEAGIRQALAIAKTQPKAKVPVLPTDRSRLRLPPRLYDAEVSSLDPGSAQQLLDGALAGDEGGRLHWAEMRLAIANSHGLRRQATTTAIGLEAVLGHHSGSGYAAGAARTLEDLRIEEIVEHARALHLSPTESSPADLPKGPCPALLAPEVTVELLNVLNAYAFSARSFLEGTSFLSKHRNVQVFDRSVHLRDDGTNASGLPFPFDFEGAPKRPLDLIVEGKPSTPALNQAQGAAAGLEPTAQSVGGQDSLFGNLFLLPGASAPDDLLAAADGGIRIGRLDHVECYDSAQLRIRAVVRGLRRIKGGRLAEALPDCIWETSLLGAMARLRGIGTRAATRSVSTTPVGAISAPGVVLEEASGLTAIS